MPLLGRTPKGSDLGTQHPPVLCSAPCFLGKRDFLGKPSLFPSIIPKKNPKHYFLAAFGLRQVSADIQRWHPLWSSPSSPAVSPPAKKTLQQWETPQILAFHLQTGSGGHILVPSSPCFCFGPGDRRFGAFTSLRLAPLGAPLPAPDIARRAPDPQWPLWGVMLVRTKQFWGVLTPKSPPHPLSSPAAPRGRGDGLWLQPLRSGWLGQQRAASHRAPKGPGGSATPRGWPQRVGLLLGRPRGCSPLKGVGDGTGAAERWRWVGAAGAARCRGRLGVLGESTAGRWPRTWRSLVRALCVSFLPQKKKPEGRGSCGWFCW